MRLLRACRILMRLMLHQRTCAHAHTHPLTHVLTKASFEQITMIHCDLLETRQYWRKHCA